MLTPIVYPSGAALAIASAPIIPPAPALFSTMKVFFVLFDIASARRRAKMSGLDPGANGAMILTVPLSGQSCADAVGAIARPAAPSVINARKESSFIRYSLQKDWLRLVEDDDAARVASRFEIGEGLWRIVD